MRKFFSFLFFIIIFLLSLFYYKTAYPIIEHLRYPLLNPFIIWASTLGLIIVSAVLAAVFFWKKKTKLITLGILNAAVSLETAFIVKMFFKIPRPFNSGEITALASAGGFSFPSMHSAYVFSLLPLLERKSLKKYYFIWLIFALFIAFSRIYLGVHSFRDIAGGALLGYTIGSIFCYLENKFLLIEKFYKKVNDELELRRQIAHALTGISIIIFYGLGYLNNFRLGLILIIGLIISLISKYHDLPIISKILNYFERGHKRYTFPGQGSFCLVLGSFLALVMFKREIAFAGIMVMAVGDSVTNIAGQYFGSIKNPLNPRKNIEGTLVAIICATVTAWYFIPLKYAFISSLIAMFIESVDLKIGRFEFDDNILIPLIVGEVLVLLGL